ncbi:MAG: class I SAM-dependent methyltransferase [Devosia sp.]
MTNPAIKQFRPAGDYVQMRTEWLKNYDRLTYTGLSGYVLRSTHALIERDFSPNDSFQHVIEVGAGTLAHLPFVRHRFDKYVVSDSDPDVVAALEKRPLPPGVEVVGLPTGAIPFPDNSFDRLIATHVLEHIPNPVSALEEWVRVLKPGGVLSIVLPCDPGLAWRVGRRLGPRSRWTTNNLPYDYFMAREHVNNIFGLISILSYHLPVGKAQWWPLGLPLPDFNLIFAANYRV